MSAAGSGDIDAVFKNSKQGTSHLGATLGGCKTYVRVLIAFVIGVIVAYVVQPKYCLETEYDAKENKCVLKLKKMNLLMVALGLAVIFYVLSMKYMPA